MEQNQLKVISSRIIDKILISRNKTKPLLIAIDGGSGSGKSTIAQIISNQLNATIVNADDFYAREITHEGWANRSYKEKVADVLNWRGLRAHVLEPLLTGMHATWNRFNFNAGEHPDGTYGIEAGVTEFLPNDIIILEGAYSTRPELSDLIHLKILIDVPVRLRHERLKNREDHEFLIHWHERWDEAEQYYFREIRPSSSFDMVIENV